MRTGCSCTSPLGPEELIAPYADNIATAITRARPARVVVSTSGKTIDAEGSPLQQPAHAALPTLLSSLEEQGVSFAVIAPRLFLENLLLPPVIDTVRSDGVLRYPIRADFPVSWASHLDIAAAAAVLLQRRDVTGIVGIGQLPAITGPDLAASFAEHLRRDVKFESITPEEFGTLITPLIGPAAAGVTGLYQALWHQPDHVIDPTTSAQQRLGLIPRTITAWLSAIGA